MTLATLPLLEAALVLPLAATLVAVSARRDAPLLLLGAMSVPMLVVAALLCMLVHAGGAQVRALGGWAAPLGIGLGADGLSALFLLATAVIVPMVALYARDVFAAPQAAGNARSFSFWPLLYAMWAALNAIFLARDLFNLYVLLELLTLAAVAMVAYGGTAAALRYLLFALMGSLAYLAGVVLVYAATGTLDIGLLYRSSEGGPAIALAGGLMTAGLLAKAALFPLHAWLPPAHGGAPAPASALLSALVVKAAFFVLVRLWFDVMPATGGRWVPELLGLLGAAAVVYGSLQAIRQRRLKLLLAWSTVAQVGYLFLMFPLAGGGDDMPWAAGAWSGGIFHALAHAFAKASLFLAAGLVAESLGHDRIGGMRGVARVMPVTVSAFGLAAVTLMGLPPSGGFMAKYLLLTSALAGGRIGYALVMLAGGLLAAAYLFLPLGRAMAKGPARPGARVAGWRQVIPLLLALVAMLMGIFSSGPYDFLQIGRPAAAEVGIE